MDKTQNEEKYTELVELFKAGDRSEALYRAEEELPTLWFFKFLDFASK